MSRTRTPSDSVGVQKREDRSQETSRNKKTKVQRACDACRRRKIRCDGSQMPDHRCSNCVTYKLECLYTEVPKTRVSPQKYVEKMESRLQSMEMLLRKLCPEANLSEEFGELSTLNKVEMKHPQRRKSQNGEDSSSSDSRSQSPLRRLAASAAPDPFLISSINTDDVLPSDDERSNSLEPSRKPLALHRVEDRFLGRSSAVLLVQATMDLKRETLGFNHSKNIHYPPHRRPEYWQRSPWEKISDEHVVHFEYPPDDLLFHLVDSYFNNMNYFMPLLHRPSFERALRSRVHYSDYGFASVVLVACAIGARWSDDPRVIIPGTSKQSAGWKYFEQIQHSYRTLVAAPRLYDLQVYALTAVYMFGTSFPQASWNPVGIGIRLALDAGAHRKKIYVPPLTVESELWKRVFWTLVVLDRTCSSALGKPCAIHDEDFDLDMPVEVDDEYWENPDPNLAFKQPEGKPSSVAYFNSVLKLTQVQALALRTLYSINESKIILGFVGPTWEQRIVAELDSALNKWIDSIPQHLQWDPHRKHALFFQQSAILIVLYHEIQILVHRPFITAQRKSSSLSFPSLAICTNAARSCSHVVDILRERFWQPLAHVLIPTFESSIILLLNVWSAKASGRIIDTEGQMTDVLKCMRILCIFENRYQAAGKFWDILNELSFAGDVPLGPIERRLPSSDVSSVTSSDRKSSDSRLNSTVFLEVHPPFLEKELTSYTSPSSGASTVSTPFQYSPSLEDRSTVDRNCSSNTHMSQRSEQYSSPELLVPHNSSNIDNSFSQSLSSYPLQYLRTAMPTQSTHLLASSPENHQLLHQFGPTESALTASTYPPNPSPSTTSDDPFSLLPDMGDYINSAADTGLQMWPAAPVSFDFDDWGMYLHNFIGSNQTPDDISNKFL